MPTLLGNAYVQITPGTQGFESEARKGILGPMAKVAGAVAGIMASVGLASFGKEMIDLAANAEQSVGGVSAVFKEYASTVQARSKEADTALGLSANAYRELATVIGSQLKNAGVPMEDLGGSTDKLIGQGADLAAMFGGTTQEAVNALSSALKGEMDPIERYGISLNETALKAKAVELGLYSGTGALDANTKAMAVMALVQQQGADSVGAFGRESDTAAGRAARAAAQWENLKTTVGDRLLPTFSRVMGYVSTTVIPGLEKMGGALQGLYDLVIKGDFTGALQDAFGWEEDSPIVGFLLSFRDVAKDVFGYLKDNAAPILSGLTATLATLAAPAIMGAVVAGFTAVGVALAAAFGPANLIAIGIGLLVAGLVKAYKESETFRNIVTGAIDTVKGAFETASVIFGRIFDIFKDGFNNADAGGGIGGFFARLGAGIEAAWPAIKVTLSRVSVVLWEWIKDAIPPALVKIGEFLGAVGSWIMDTGLPWLKDKALALGAAIVDWIGPRIGPALVAIGGFLGSIVTWIADVGLPLLWDKVQTLGKAIIDWIAPRIPGLLGELGGFIGSALGWIIGTGIPLLVGALLKLSWELIKWIAPRIPGLLAELASFLGSALTWVVTTGIPLLVESFINFGKKGIAALFEGLRSSPLADLGRELLDNLGSGLTDFGDKVKKWAGNIKDKIIGEIKSLFGIASPSKEMAKLGTNMIDGLLKGLSDGKGNLTAIVKSIGGTISGGWSNITGMAGTAVSKVGDFIGLGGSAPSGDMQSKLVGLGRTLQGRGFRVGEHPAFGRVGRHSNGSAHYSGRAIDVNFGPGGASAVEKAAIDSIMPYVKSLGFKTIWQAPGHYDHLHVAYDKGGLARGMGYMPKATIRPERVLNPRQTEAFEKAMSGGFGGQSPVVDTIIINQSANPRRDLEEVTFKMRTIRRGGLYA